MYSHCLKFAKSKRNTKKNEFASLGSSNHSTNRYPNFVHRRGGNDLLQESRAQRFVEWSGEELFSDLSTQRALARIGNARFRNLNAEKQFAAE